MTDQSPPDIRPQATICGEVWIVCIMFVISLGWGRARITALIE
ncbi:hypothetical protein [Jannaschia donghaensis]|nr:hypothetical protein [Jannaschia donghaensis]